MIYLNTSSHDSLFSIMHSSQCVWSEPLNPRKIIESLEPVQKYTYISSDSFKPPTSEAQKASLTLKECVEQAELAISVPRNDSQDRFLIKSNRLYCLLTPESFSAFGLDATRVNNSHLREHHYLAVYELNVPGKRLDRLQWALENTIDGTHTFWITSKKGMGSQNCIDKGVSMSTSAQVGIPSLNAPSDPDEFIDWSNFITEWIGLCVLNPALLSLNNSVDRSLCTFDQYPDVEYGTVAVTHQTGLFTSEDMINIWSQAENVDWAVLHVQGFSGVPVAWSRDSVHQGGELGYTLIRCGGRVECLKYI